MNASNEKRVTAKARPGRILVAGGAGFVGVTWRTAFALRESIPLYDNLSHLEPK